MDSGKDQRGNKIGNGSDCTYMILTEHDFEDRLKRFDQRLKLCFDQVKKHWTILEKAYIGPNWNVIIRCEDKFNNPLPLGDWVFHTLHEMRVQYYEKEKNRTRWVDNLFYEQDRLEEIERKKIRQESWDMARDDKLQYKKAFYEINNKPVADATAGFQMAVKHQPKGKIYG